MSGLQWARYSKRYHWDSPHRCLPHESGVLLLPLPGHSGWEQANDPAPPTKRKTPIIKHFIVTKSCHVLSCHIRSYVQGHRLYTNVVLLSN